MSLYFKNKYIQLLIAIFIIFFILFIDNISGFILGVSLLVVYFKIYNKELKNRKGAINKNKVDSSVCTADQCFLDNVKNKQYSDVVESNIEKDKNKIQLSYITEEHLLAAQNNIFDTENYDIEFKSNDNELIYGAQGLDNNNIHLRGNDKFLEYLGGLSYSVNE